jgi:transposase
MRGVFSDQGRLFSYISPEARVRADHPLRKIRKLVRDVLGELNRSLSRLYASEGRPSIPPEQLLSALLLQVFYGIRSERQLMEQLDYNLLYRWFVGLSPDDPVWDPTVLTKNRDRLQNGEVFAKFMTKLLNHPQVIDQRPVDRKMLIRPRGPGRAQRGLHAAQADSAQSAEQRL